ncbi:hypothetical protein TNCV_41721 [Trichonephila clavipes]|nr:hypothetical protein TNCV_41721 [Trichonephila clavipes]
MIFYVVQLSAVWNVGVPSWKYPRNLESPRMSSPGFGNDFKMMAMVSAADKGCRVYPLDPRPDAVALYSGCTLGKRRAWFCQMTGTLPPLLDSVVGGGTPG